MGFRDRSVGLTCHTANIHGKRNGTRNSDRGYTRVTRRKLVGSKLQLSLVITIAVSSVA